MKVSKIHIPSFVKTSALVLPLMLTAPIVKAQVNEPDKDVFVKTIDNNSMMTDSVSFAPNIRVGDDYKYVAAVVDLSEKNLYHYDLDGTLLGVYPVAVGKKSTSTRSGIRVVTDIENYPYRNAPKTTKRYKNPNDYGTKLVCLDEVDSKTGEIIPGNGQFIHGTFKPESIGKNVSKGCVRLKNEDVEILVTRLYKNQYILIKE